MVFDGSLTVSVRDIKPHPLLMHSLSQPLKCAVNWCTVRARDLELSDRRGWKTVKFSKVLVTLIWNPAISLCECSRSVEAEKPCADYEGMVYTWLHARDGNQESHPHNQNRRTASSTKTKWERCPCQGGCQGSYRIISSWDGNKKMGMDDKTRHLPAATQHPSPRKGLVDCGWALDRDDSSQKQPFKLVCPPPIAPMGTLGMGAT